VFRVAILTVSLAAIMLCGLITPVDAAQMTFRTFSQSGVVEEVEIKFQRSVILNYDDGGQLADQLRGLKVTKTFSADSSDPGVNELRDRMNYFVKNVAHSDAAITDVTIDYDTTLTGRGLNTSIDYKVIVTLSITNHIIRDFSGSSAGLIDMDWRGVTIDGPVVINVNGVDNEINLPISFIANAAPALYTSVQGTEAEAILNTPLMDASGIKAQPLGNWHFLFDPTGINVDASQFGMSEELAGLVWSSYTMGESSLREGIQTEKEQTTTFTTDKTYDLRTIESADAANVFVAGFANVDVLSDSEVFGFSPTAPEGYATTSTGGFPMMIIYGMAGMAAVVGGMVFIISEKKRKKDLGNVQQTGIDPSQLVGAATSTGSGGYKTNRGEAHLKSDEYSQHRSVYDSPQVEEKTAPAEEKKESTKGSMPKGWKPE
jgi:hypothetical protein